MHHLLLPLLLRGQDGSGGHRAAVDPSNAPRPRQPLDFRRPHKWANGITRFAFMAAYTVTHTEPQPFASPRPHTGSRLHTGPQPHTGPRHLTRSTHRILTHVPRPHTVHDPPPFSVSAGVLRLVCFRSGRAFLSITNLDGLWCPHFL